MIIQGIYIKELFFDAEPGRALFLLKPSVDMPEYSSANGLVRAVGKFCLHQKYMPLYMVGDWKKDEYGFKFEFSNIYESSAPIDETEKFLELLCGKQISHRELKKLIKVVGNDVFSLLSIQDVELKIQKKTGIDLLAVSGLTNKLRYLKNKMDLFVLIDSNGGTYAHCKKILAKFPDNALEIIHKDAYEILQKVNIPFQVIDRIALKAGADSCCLSRIRAILLWAIRKETNAGSTYVTLETLEKIVKNVYGNIPMSAITAALTDHPMVIKDNTADVYYEKKLFYDELHAAKEFARLYLSRKEIPWHPELIEELEKDNGYKLGEQQRKSFGLLRNTGIKLLTGDPGTGKTTTVNVLLQYLDRVAKMNGVKLKIALCAPAGRAAQRMKETTSRNALTIHKLLEFQPYGDNEIYRDENDPIDADVIVVDETSMLGLSLFSKLLGAVKSGSLLLFVGDVNQLPSVEPGNVLQDMIKCGYVDFCHLSEVFRQSEESLIVKNAKEIVNGNGRLLEGDDFEIIKTGEDIEKDVLECVNQLLEECDNKNDIQILCPVRKGMGGVKKLNNLSQNLFNPGKGGIWYGYRNYRPHDRVILLSNNYSMNYFNGDVGYITDIVDENVHVQVGENCIELSQELLSDMDLSYVITVHKSQGSEYPYVVLVLPKEAHGILDQNLLYTAVTRAKKKIKILYEDDMLNVALKTKRRENRKTLLAVKIRQQIRQMEKNPL